MQLKELQADIYFVVFNVPEIIPVLVVDMCIISTAAAVKIVCIIQLP
jgi:hypothetical protein